MQRYSIEYLRTALDDITSIYLYILTASQNRTTTERYIDRIYERCERICDAPFGGIARPDLGDDLRMAVFERSVVILYAIENDLVKITNIFGGGQDYGAVLQKDH